MLRMFARHTIEECLLQPGGDRAARTATDGAVVQFTDRRHFGGRAGEECLVGAIYLVARDALLDQLYARVFRQRDDGVARDALQARGQVGSVELALLDHKQVFARTLGHIAVYIQQQRLIVAVVRDFLMREDGIGVGADRFGTAHVDVDVVAAMPIASEP